MVKYQKVSKYYDHDFRANFHYRHFNFVELDHNQFRNHLINLNGKEDMIGIHRFQIFGRSRGIFDEVLGFN